MRYRLKAPEINRGAIIFYSAIFIFILFANSAPAVEIKGQANPAIQYCEFLGYGWYSTIDVSGNEYAVCILPDGSEVDAWDFYKGKVGKSYSYCARQGYGTTSEKIKQDGFNVECSVCVSKSGDRASSDKIAMIDLLHQDGFRFFEPENKKMRLQHHQQKAPFFKKIFETKTAPNAFDWRDYNNQSYIGPIRDQGSCGSCYSFGALAAAEGSYNFSNNLSDWDCVDFSESYIIWCLSNFPAYSSHFNGCNGADYEYKELEALTVNGIIFESYFPYTYPDPGCSASSIPTIKFSSWGRVQPLDIEGIKNAIYSYGPVDAAVYVSTNFSNYSGGIFSDTATTCPDGAYTTTNHAIALVGWGHDDTYGDYWILRNSWGRSWGENGYMRIAVTSARVACSAAYVNFAPTTTPPQADFYAETSGGLNVDHLITNSTTGDNVAYTWTISPETYTFVNGTNHNSVSPVLQFTAPGLYTVSLTAQNAYGTDTETKVDYINISGSNQTIRLNLTTDNYGNETTWSLNDSQNNSLYSGGPYTSNTSYEINFSLPAGNYSFRINDSWGDGICCYVGYGSYSLTNLSTSQTIVSGGAFSFSETTNFAVTAQVPIVTTQPATNIGNTSATLNGIVNPNEYETDYYFEYDTTTSYGWTTTAVSAGSGTSDIAVSNSAGLLPGTTYHYRVVGTNASGTAYGSDQTFQTTANAPIDTDAVHRFYSSTGGSHFFTISEMEKDSIIGNYPENVWKYEGAAWYCYTPENAPPEASAVYRFYSATQGAHFFTISEAEKDAIIAIYPDDVWHYEGIAWYCYTPENAPPETSAVYRFYSSTEGAHFFTISEAEKDAIIAIYPDEVWHYEGIAWYCYTGY